MSTDGSKMYATFELALKQELISNQVGKQKDTNSGSLRRVKGLINTNNLIKTIWSIVVHQQATISAKGRQPLTPLLPKLLEELFGFSRPEKSLTKEELVMLYQIKIHTNKFIEEGLVPHNFVKVIPDDVLEACEKEYHLSDAKSDYPEIQKDIARKLLKLRVSFEENADTEAYKVDFRLHDAHKNNVILIKGPVNSSEATG